MKGNPPTGRLSLPLVRWTGSCSEIRLEVPASECPLLVEADATGTVILEGKAEIGPTEIVVDLRVRVSTREICGRSLEPFDHPLDFPLRLLLHRSGEVQGAQWEEDGEDIWEAKVSDDLRELDIEEAVRQAIELERPISPVKPGVPLPAGVEPEADPADEKPVDPRWEALLKLKGGRV